MTTATTITREIPHALATQLVLLHQMYPPPEIPHPIVITNRQGLGDTVCLSAMIRDLALTYPRHFKIWVRAQYPAVFVNNPYVVPQAQYQKPPSEADEFLVEVWPPEYHDYSPHMLHLFHRQFIRLATNRHTDPPFPPLERGLSPLIHAGDIHLTPQEIGDMSTRHLQYGKPRWMIAAGGKTDFTTKLWPPSYYQAVVDLLPEVQFYQIGRADDVHVPLENTVDLVGKLESRELIQLMYFMEGFVGPICGPMHLAAATPTPTGRLRSIVTIGGGRESVQFYAYENHIPLHRVGHPAFDCAHGGACWAHDSSGITEDYIGPQNKTVPKCKYPEPGGYARCMLHITPEEVAQAIRSQL